VQALNSSPSTAKRQTNKNSPGDNGGRVEDSTLRSIFFFKKATSFLPIT
jgi:hypothetical protein